MTKNRPSTTGESMTADERVTFIRNTAKSHRLSHTDFALFTGYSRHSIAGWFSDCDSSRHRDVPARAVDRLCLELASEHVNSVKSTGGLPHVLLLPAL